MPISSIDSCGRNSRRGPLLRGRCAPNENAPLSLETAPSPPEARCAFSFDRESNFMSVGRCGEEEIQSIH